MITSLEAPYKKEFYFITSIQLTTTKPLHNGYLL